MLTPLPGLAWDKPLESRALLRLRQERLDHLDIFRRLSRGLKLMIHHIFSDINVNVTTRNPPKTDLTSESECQLKGACQ